MALFGADPGYFTRNVYPVLEKAGCRGCHNPAGVANVTRLKFPEPEAQSERVEAFGKSLAALVNREAPENSLLFVKPTNRVPHAGGQRIAPGSQEEEVWRAWMKRLAGMSKEEIAAALKIPEPAAARPEAHLRRLTHSQYNHTVRDLLGDNSAPANLFPPEDYVNGFKNQLHAQSISPLLAEAYSAAAEKLARNALRGDTRRLIPCPMGPGLPADAACAARFIREFGKKAFRRPVTESEFRRYSALFDTEAKAAGDFLKGAQIVVEAMLQSPAFLFRLEDTAEPAWKPYAAASRLSYFLWDTMPDEPLLRSAEAGELDTAAAVERAARRMLTDPRAREALDEFVSQWLRFDRLLGTVKDRRQFPMFTVELTRSAVEETRRFVADLVWNDGDFRQFFTADYSFLSSDLAALYGLTAPAQEFDKVMFAADSDRAGVLGQVTFLALTSKPAETSPTARGLFVREQFLCQHVPEPPPGVAANLPPLREAMPQTNRERLAEHRSNPSCATCHNLIDPIGFGLEKFDPVGVRREKLKLTFFPTRQERNKEATRVELELDTRGSIAGIPKSNFTSPKQLGAILAASPQCHECVVRQVFRYSSGRHETAADEPVIRRAVAAFQGSQFRFKEIMIAIASSPGGPVTVSRASR